MAHYFLQLREGKTTRPDPGEHKFSSAPRAMAAALEVAREIADDRMRDGLELGIDAVEVVSENGQYLGSILLRSVARLNSSTR
ncbi:hypothetical protein GCM10007989_24570 [Devosia pacifica]|uniref:DUF6894 domain-containing protein n=1 Tax=Devosia pacifica TaxID=1335967 RepID=A0A918S756_9HYPH|nr:hypothetical protein GCM10007989_24570 [Devosia pacifica]